jgi:pilus assembly protein Flp/PilA
MVGMFCSVSGALGRTLRNAEGATAIEYALIASLISIAILVGSTLIGTNLDAIFSSVASNLT